MKIYVDQIKRIFNKHHKLCIHSSLNKHCRDTFAIQWGKVVAPDSTNEFNCPWLETEKCLRYAAGKGNEVIFFPTEKAVVEGVAFEKNGCVWEGETIHNRIDRWKSLHRKINAFDWVEWMINTWFHNPAQVKKKSPSRILILIQESSFFSSQPQHWERGALCEVVVQLVKL